MSLCIVAVIILAGVLTDFAADVADARRLPRRHHPHHQRWNDYDLEDSMPRALPSRRPEDHRHWRTLEPSRETEDSREEDQGYRARPWRHRFQVPEDETEIDGALATRTKRHPIDVSKSKTEKRSRKVTIHMGDKHWTDARKDYEKTAEEMQKYSICNYTIEPVVDRNGKPISEDLKHIRCHDQGSQCHEPPYHCVQTYRDIKVKRDDDNGSKNKYYTVKLLTGCVCGIISDANLGISLSDLSSR